MEQIEIDGLHMADERVGRGQPRVRGRDNAAIEAEMAERKSLPTLHTIRPYTNWVKNRTITAVRPRPGWAPYFEELLKTLPGERETGLESATGCKARGY
jgi:hypothetical protein